MRRFLEVTILIALISPTPGCAQSGSRDELRAMPEATLTFPGSEELEHGGGDAETTLVGPQSAFAWRWLGVNASPDEIERFYAEELAANGWTEGGGSSGAPMTTEFNARAWHKGDVVFRLGFPDPEQRSDAAREWFAAYQTVYDARLIGKEIEN
jgi:hypothetical protein